MSGSQAVNSNAHGIALALEVIFMIDQKTYKGYNEGGNVMLLII